MRVRAHFKNIDEVIATIKAATIKNKDRKKDFHDAGLPSPGRRTEPERKPKTRINRFLLLNPNRTVTFII